MIEIHDIIVDESIATTRFACDLSACKGACCTMPGGRGAPVEDSEVEALMGSVAAALPYLSERNRTVIEAFGPLEGKPGNLATRCIESRDCVFVYYEGDVAKCAIERAHFNGETPFRKPVSCHLFPIRVGDVLGGAYLRYEKIRECQPALERGAREGIPLYRFLKDAVVRAFGLKAYRELENAIESKMARRRRRV